MTTAAVHNKYTSAQIAKNLEKAFDIKPQSITVEPRKNQDVPNFIRRFNKLQKMADGSQLRFQ